MPFNVIMSWMYCITYQQLLTASIHLMGSKIAIAYQQIY